MIDWYPNYQPKPMTESGTIVLKRSSEVGDIVEVIWNDAWYDDDSSSALDALEKMYPFRTTTVGYLLGSTEAGVLLSRDHYPSTSTYKHRHFIPAGMMISMRALK